MTNLDSIIINNRNAARKARTWKALMLSTLALIIIAFIALIATVGPAFATPCAEEDSANCSWDATTHGNGLGKSFVNINDYIIILP